MFTNIFNQRSTSRGSSRKSPQRRAVAGGGAVLLGIATLGALALAVPAQAVVVGPVCGGMDEAAAVNAGYVPLVDQTQAVVYTDVVGQRDWIVAGDFADDINAGDRGDIVCTRGGEDEVRGDQGADRIYLGATDFEDFAEGGPGADLLNGGEADDTLWGDDAAGYLGGSPTDGRDTIYGGEGEDGLLGKGKADDLFGGKDDDYLAGADGADVLTGGGGTADEAWCGNGVDIFDTEIADVISCP